MSNALYDKGREGFLDGSIDWDTDTIKAALVKTAYTPDLANHDNWDDVSANVVGTPQTLTGKTVAAGVADAADITFSSVSGDQCSYIVLYKDTGTPSTSRLIACIDTATGLPVTPNGGDITVTWDDTAGLKIFKL